MMLSLIEKFCQIYQKKLNQEQEIKLKKKNDRKKALHLTNS